MHQHVDPTPISPHADELEALHDTYEHLCNQASRALGRDDLAGAKRWIAVAGNAVDVGLASIGAPMNEDTDQ